MSDRANLPDTEPDDRQDEPADEPPGRAAYLHYKERVRDYSFKKVATLHLDALAAVEGSWC